MVGFFLWGAGEQGGFPPFPSNRENPVVYYIPTWLDDNEKVKLYYFIEETVKVLKYYLLLKKCLSFCLSNCFMYYLTCFCF